MWILMYMYIQISLLSACACTVIPQFHLDDSNNMHVILQTELYECEGSSLASKLPR